MEATRSFNVGPKVSYSTTREDADTWNYGSENHKQFAPPNICTTDHRHEKCSNEQPAYNAHVLRHYFIVTSRRLASLLKRAMKEVCVTQHLCLRAEGKHFSILFMMSKNLVLTAVQ